MMYEFCDTNGAPSSAALPAEAICYNGIWPDEDISLYRTLYVSGRESFCSGIMELALESMDGAAFLRRRLLPRTIQVGYQILASNAQELIMAYNRLNKIMSGTQVQIIFADEQDKYYIGTCKSIGTPEPGKLSVKAEMEIYCSDPCKYAVQEKTVSPDNGIFSVEYAGSYPARPTFTAVFSGDAKHVMFTGEEAIVTAGDEEAESAVFTDGDSLVIDCAAARIWLNEEEAPELGNVTNQYESMQLNPGPNAVTPSCTGTSPAFSMKYREAWL